MAIRAILRKNTPEIQKRIRKMGIPCTQYLESDLFYTEYTNEVTWYHGSCVDGTYDCKEDEKLFFYLMSLNTLNDTETRILREQCSHYKDEYDRYQNLYLDSSTKVFALERKVDTLTTQLNKVLEAYDYKTLEKENDELKKLVNLLQEQTASLIKNKIEQIHGLLREM